jgi:hypothetical protein
MNHVPRMNRTESGDLKFVYNFYSLHFSVACVLMIASPLEEEVQNEVQTPKLEALMVDINDKKC